MVRKKSEINISINSMSEKLMIEYCKTVQHEKNLKTKSSCKICSIGLAARLCLYNISKCSITNH